MKICSLILPFYHKYRLFEAINSNRCKHRGNLLDYREIFDIKSINDLTEQILSKIVNHLNEIIKDYPNNQKNNQQGFQMQTKNIILYGPPGVGKTYNHKKLISLIEEGQGQKEIFDGIKDNDIEHDEALFDTVESENRFKFVTFHQSYSYEDFIEGFRPQEDGNIELVDGIFKEISKEASENLENSQKEKKFDFETFLNDFIQDVEQNENYEIDDNLTITVKKKSNGEFQSFQTGGRVKEQALTRDVIKRDFEQFLEGKIKSFQDVKPSFQSQSSYHGNAPYYFKLYQQMKKFLDDRGNNYSSQKEQQKNFYLVIDEINRGNISKIFGELITLIEDDKRDEIEVTLPYSKEPFKVPSNLYIIATMNSTDKSIALIDVALRRRFTFLKMKPDINLVHEDAKKLFEELNKFITKKLGEDYQIGHSYFMKKDRENLDIDFVLEYKIKPLLEEYFYGDEESLAHVLDIIKNF